MKPCLIHKQILFFVFLLSLPFRHPMYIYIYICNQYVTCVYKSAFNQLATSVWVTAPSPYSTQRVDPTSSAIPTTAAAIPTATHAACSSMCRGSIHCARRCDATRRNRLAAAKATAATASATSSWPAAQRQQQRLQLQRERHWTSHCCWWVCCRVLSSRHLCAIP